MGAAPPPLGNAYGHRRQVSNLTLMPPGLINESTARTYFPLDARERGARQLLVEVIATIPLYSDSCPALPRHHVWFSLLHQ